MDDPDLIWTRKRAEKKGDEWCSIIFKSINSMIGFHSQTAEDAVWSFSIHFTTDFIALSSTTPSSRWRSASFSAKSAARPSWARTISSSMPRPNMTARVPISVSFARRYCRLQRWLRHNLSHSYLVVFPPTQLPGHAQNVWLLHESGPSKTQVWDLWQNLLSTSKTKASSKSDALKWVNGM